MGTKSAASSSTGNALLTIPGIGSITFDCAANGSDSTVHIANSSGSALASAGQDQNSTSSTLNPVGHIANGANTFLDHSGASTLDTTRFQLWSSQTGKTATIEISNLACDYTA
jgi:hypothetical protein